MTSFEQRTISADAAARCLTAARTRARQLAIAVSIAVVDTSGTLKAFLRTDGARLVSVDTAQRKAYTAVALEASTHDLQEWYRDQPALLGLIGGLPGLAAIGGGVPLRAGEVLVGAIGVSGGSAAQDVEVAETAASALSGS